jgi:hypothetical protein
MIKKEQTWQERFYNKFGLNGLHAKPVEYMEYEDVSEEVKQFISDLRKKDEEELIKMLPDYRMVFPEQDTEDIIKYKLGFNDGIQKIKQLIKDYYEN